MNYVGGSNSSEFHPTGMLERYRLPDCFKEITSFSAVQTNDYSLGSSVEEVYGSVVWTTQWSFILGALNMLSILKG